MAFRFVLRNKTNEVKTLNQILSVESPKREKKKKTRTSGPIEIDKILRYNINQIKKKMVNKEFPFNDEKIKEYYKQFEEETKKKGDYENKD